MNRIKWIAVYAISLILFLLTFGKANAQVTPPVHTPANNIFDRTRAQAELFEHYGADNSEAEFTLNLQLNMRQSAAPTRSQADPQIRAQMRYMLGLMRSREKYAAALYPKWTYTIDETKRTAAGLWAVKYTLQGKGTFANGTRQYGFTVPLDPKTIFAKAQRKCNVEKAVAESNYWYHWEPLLEGCPLKENEDYVNVSSELRVLPNTVLTSPEYEKLVDADKTIKMTMLLGFADHGQTNWSSEGEDWGAVTFRQQRDLLKSLGFSETVWDRAQVERIFKPRDRFVPLVSEFSLAGARATIRVRLMLADTEYYHNSRGFHFFLKDSLAHESVVVYNGHSGIGKNLDLAGIERTRGFRFTFNPGYQILFLGSCVPYAYYTDMMFSRKASAADPKGTLNLDIFTYGKESFFASTEDSFLTRALVAFARNGERTSYQQIINAGPKTSFIAINGDEDNPTR